MTRVYGFLHKGKRRLILNSFCVRLPSNSGLLFRPRATVAALKAGFADFPRIKLQHYPGDPFWVVVIVVAWMLFMVALLR